jgi:superfamily II DNA or RNA helicase
VLVNCALFEEGLDIPGLEAVQIAKPTQSLSRWLQMFGRSLRVSEGKEHAIVIDHTKNWSKHGLPTHPRIWTLEGVEFEDVRLRQNVNLEVEEIEEVEEIICQSPMMPIILENNLTEISAEISLERFWDSQLINLYQQQQRSDYKPQWVFHKLKELKAPLRIWHQYGEKMGYKAGWAWYQWSDCQDEKFQLGQQESPLSAK